jgi:hypothetical protein
VQPTIETTTLANIRRESLKRGGFAAQLYNLGYVPVVVTERHPIFNIYSFKDKALFQEKFVGKNSIKLLIEYILKVQINTKELDELLFLGITVERVTENPNIADCIYERGGRLIFNRPTATDADWQTKLELANWGDKLEIIYQNCNNESEMFLLLKEYMGLRA